MLYEGVTIDLEYESSSQRVSKVHLVNNDKFPEKTEISIEAYMDNSEVRKIIETSPEVDDTNSATIAPGLVNSS